MTWFEKKAQFFLFRVIKLNAWMFYSRTTNNRINQLHDRALQQVYLTMISFEELLEKNGSFTEHNCNVQTLTIDI